VFVTNTMPIKLSPEDRARANDVYDHWAQSLDQYEASPDVSAFSSKFDAFLHDPTTTPLSADEMAGYNLFRGKANCNSCHLDGRSTAPSPTAPSSTDTGTAADTRPVFHLLRLGKSRLAAESEGCDLLSEHAGFFRLHGQSLWLWLPRSGARNFPTKRSRLLAKPE